MAAIATKVLVSLGALTATFFTSKLLMLILLSLRPGTISLYRHSPPRDPTSRPWAIVTGASSGLGFSLACELASQGFNIVLHGRSPERLSRAARDIQTRHPSTDTKLLILDASQLPCSSSSWRTFSTTIQTVLSPLHLTVVVNNVGGNTNVTPEWGLIRQRSHEKIDSLLTLNFRFTLHLTREVLPLLARHGRPALVLNVSSAAARLPLPYNAMYGAAKAALSSWGWSLRLEMWEEVGEGGMRGVEVLTLEVGKVVTEGARRSMERDLSFETLRPEVVARACLDRVGCGYHVVTPNLVHQLQGGL